MKATYNEEDLEKMRLLFSTTTPNAIGISTGEMNRLASTYGDLIRKFRAYDVFTMDRVEGLTAEDYAFIRSVYARQHIMIPWVDYNAGQSPFYFLPPTDAKTEMNLEE